MGRKNKPFWRADRGAYYSKVRGKKLRLATTLKESWEVLRQQLETRTTTNVRDESMAALLDAFLQWNKEHRADKTYRGHKDFCQPFLNRWPELRISQITSRHVTEWLEGMTNWNSTTKRSAIATIQRAFNWGRDNWGIDKNPINRIEKPQANVRERIISEGEFKTILANVKQGFSDLLTFTAETGCRPAEVKQLESRHIDLVRHVCVLPASEAKGKRRPRFIYMTTTAEQVVRRLLKKHPTGAIFRNARGAAWTANSVNGQFEILEDKVGVKYCHANFRHTWITAKIIEGIDSHVVAKLVGHADSKMIDKVYSKVAADHDFMLRAARQKPKRPAKKKRKPR